MGLPCEASPYSRGRAQGLAWRAQVALAFPSKFSAFALMASNATVAAWPRAALPFYTVTGCHRLPFLGDSHNNIAVIAVIFCRNGSVAHG